MTNYEANIRDNLKYETEKRAILYFPNIRQDFHYMLTGQVKIEGIQNIDGSVKTDRLLDAYSSIINDQFDGHDMPINITIHGRGLVFSIIEKPEITKDEKENSEFIPYKQHEYLVLDWEKDVSLIKILAQLMNNHLLECIRIIPDLKKSKTFRNVGRIDQNPLYDQIVFIYALHLKLGLVENLVGCYVQLMMLTKHTTFVSMCHALRYVTNLPEVIKKYLSDPAIIYDKEIFERQDDKFVSTNKTIGHITLVDYSGEKFIHKLSLFTSMKKQQLEGDRYLLVEGDDSILGNKNYNDED